MKNILKEFNILYAEDDKSVQDSVVEYLKRYFKEVHVANNGKEALELYEQKKVDVLLLDIDMPYLDGLSFAKIVRASNKEIPIVMITAFTDTDKLLKATELNLSKYLVKPVEPKAFKEVLEKVAEHLHSNTKGYVALKENYSWDKEKKELFKGSTLIELSTKEQILLGLLAKEKGKTVLFTDIMAFVWEDDFDAEISIESVKFQVSMLRKKLPKDSIKNVYGRGYVLNR